jgi:molecular chaperone GrpE
VNARVSRKEIVRRFEAWLDLALADEEPPRGVEAEILASLTAGTAKGVPHDAYSVWAAVTALTQEVKLQGRSFKELNTTLDTQASRMTERERDELQRESERRCRKEFLGLIIDLRDRLRRGWESVQASETQLAKAEAPRGWRARLFPPPDNNAAAAVFEALKKGYELGLDRLDQTLEEYNAREIPCEGQPFDPRRMNAIDREESSAIPEGTVIEVYRSGYEWNGEVFRPAQVKVSCAPVGKENE